MDPLELERLIDRELQDTPAPRAPETLLPRVMQAVRAAQIEPGAFRPAPSVSSGPAPSLSGGWRTWPVAGQIAAAVGVLLLGIGLSNLLPLLYDLINAALANPASGTTGARVAGVLHQLEAAATAARVLWRVIEPVIVFLCAVVTVMALACALFGTALGRVVTLGGASRS
jgi:hypothetical protein